MLIGVSFFIELHSFISSYNVMCLNHLSFYILSRCMCRSEVEKDLSFLGLMVMENRLKPETTPVIHQLNKANISTSE